MMISTIRLRARAAARWPFSSELAAPLWLGLRIYLGSVWLQFGLSKVGADWLTTNQMGGILELIASGRTPAPLPQYRTVADTILALNLDRLLSAAIPVLEIGVAAAFFSGVLLVPAAVGATLLNLNLILSGIATWSFDGRIMVLQILLLLAWPVAGYLGIGESLRALLRSYRALLRGHRPHSLG